MGFPSWFPSSTEYTTTSYPIWGNKKASAWGPDSLSSSGIWKGICMRPRFTLLQWRMKRQDVGCRPPMLCHPSPPHIHAVFHRHGKLVTVIVRMIINAVNTMPHLIRVSLFDTVQWWHMLTDWNATACDGHCWTADTSDKETAMSVALSDSYQSQHESTKNIKSAFVR